jgi:transcriptional regulator with XRE-family HTH domain
MKDIRVIVAANVRRLRLERGLSQQALAHRAGISLRYMSTVEAGTAAVSVRILVKLAGALDVETGELTLLRRR